MLLFESFAALLLRCVASNPLCAFERSTKTGRMTEEPSEFENSVAKAVLDAAFTVHNNLGPGLLESGFIREVGLSLAMDRLEA